jgi:gamma-glutamyltranspeptidase/glutathione hydrolase
MRARRCLAAIVAAPLLVVLPRAVYADTLSAGAVAVTDTYGAQTAEEVLKAGGNAVDAAVAVAFTLAVTDPQAGNIGGGGLMTLLVRGRPFFLDYREMAPAKARSDMYLDSAGHVIPDASRTGAKAVGVPGTVAGMWEAHRRFGILPWSRDLAPAIRLAAEGFSVDRRLAAMRDHASAHFAGRTNFASYFGAFTEGSTFRQPQLAATLDRIAHMGRDGFYRGKTAELLVQSMNHDGGLIDAADLWSYRAIWRRPILAKWRGFQVISAPPPSSGGIGLIQLLKMKADLAADFQDVPLNSAHYIHLLAEMEKRVFADRAALLGDPDFVQVPVARLISDSYNRLRASQVNPDRQTVTEGGKPDSDENMQTTHFSIVDKWGNAVSNTYTLNGFFGSGNVVAGAGFLLNDEMDDFSAKAGVPNGFGVIGGDANAIMPHKRPLSSMAPTILTRDGKVALVIGTPGGSRIFTTIFQVLADRYDYGLPLDRAVAQMRVHHQLFPAHVIFTESFSKPDEGVTHALEALGYVLREQPFGGEVDAVEITDGVPFPVADPRGAGAALVIK